MNHITADDAMLARLDGIIQPVEIRDPAGKVLGHYMPAAPADPAERERIRALFDFEEAKRVAREERHLARPFSEIIQRLQSQTPGPEQ